VTNPSRTTQRHTVPYRTIAATIGMVLLTVLAIALVIKAQRVLVWILIAAFFAVALNPVVNWLQRHLAWCRRSLATLLVFLLVLAVLIGLGVLFVVPLVREGTQLAQQFPSLLADARSGRGSVGSLLERFHVLEYAQRNEASLRKAVSGFGSSAVPVLRGAATSIAGGLTIFVVAYLIVLEMPKIIGGTLALMPASRADRVQRVGADCARTVTGYLSGNLLISIICGGLTYLVLLISGVPFAGLIALFVALADLVPLIGATLGAVVAVIAALTHSVTAGVAVAVFFVVYQQLENHLLQPVIMSRTVMLNPLTVLVSVLIAVELAGILGALLAIPVAGIIQVVARDVWDSRHGRPKSEPTVGENLTPVSETA